MNQLSEPSFIMLYILLFLMICSTSLAEVIQSCLYPPCRYNVYREDDNGNVVVSDGSSHVISWNWEVKGGRWNVTYHYIYPDDWYEGTATFMNCSNILSGKEQPFVSWGSSKSWKSNALPIYANAWNITYNGDVFGFIPTKNGKYIFRIFTRNKRHNPFGSEELVLAPGSCSLQSSDKAKIKMWWADRKHLKNCQESVFTWSWETNAGRWHVVYKWVTDTDKISSSIFYKEHRKNVENIINWEIDLRQNLVAYKSKPIRIRGEDVWNIDLSSTEVWGFYPTSQGQWIIKNFSRNLVFQPFIDQHEMLISEVSEEIYGS